LLDWTFSVKETSVCIVDEVGKIVREVKVASEPTLIYFALVLATVPVGAVSSISWLILRLGYRAYRKRRDILAIHPGAARFCRRHQNLANASVRAESAKLAMRVGDLVA
jgi:hypothetical protein